MKERFLQKEAELLMRVNFDAEMIDKGLADKQFVLIGMLIEGNVMLSEGADCFVANGYPPHHISKRDNVSSVKYVMTHCFAVEREGHKVKLDYIGNDEDVLREEIVRKRLSTIALKKGYNDDDIPSLRRLTDGSLVWEKWTSDGRQRIILRCYVDSGRFEEYRILGDEMPSKPVELDEKLESSYSCYIAKQTQNGLVLTRDEWTRKLEGVGAFIS